MYLILSEADCERLGAPGRIPIDLSTITNREAIQLRAMGYRTPRLFGRAIVPIRLDAGGNEVAGEDPSGSEVADYEFDYNAWTALVWLALKRSGIDVDISSLEFDALAVRTAPDDEPEMDASPKGEAPPALKASKTSRTTTSKSSAI